MTVILIHGMFCGTSCWNLVDELLREQGIAPKKVSLHPDGVSKRGRGFEAVTASAKAQIHGLSSQPFVLVGHSLGALVVEELLAAFPLAVPILINPSPGWGFFGPMYPLWVAARRGLFWKHIVDLDEDECRRLLFQGMSDKELEGALEIVEPESGELVRQAFWFFDLIGASTRILRKPTCNITVLTGALDPIGSPAYGRRLVSQYGRGSNLEVVERVGHMSILQMAGAQTLVKRITAASDADRWAA
jgi:pimeloyl-ACP methyl ester carboxylesterase